MDIKSLENIDFDTLFHAFENAFYDYEVNFDKEEIRSILTRRGYDPRLSFAAFVDDEIVSFTLNGFGHFNGIPTAYDTGTGTVKDFRGEGIAGKIFSHSLPFLKASGVKQYLLEVLQNNHKAIKIYHKMGFETIREFDCFRQDIAEIENVEAIKPKAAIQIESVDVDAVRGAGNFCDFSPSWQNSFESIERGKQGLTCFGAILSGILVGYCVIDHTAGDLTQIAVSPEWRRKGIATRLLHRALSMMNTDFIKVLNVPTDDSSIHGFLSSKNIPLMNKQLEMTLMF